MALGRGATNGVLFRNSRVRVADVTDGLSGTIFVAEVCLDERRDKWGGPYTVRRVPA